MKNKHKTIFVLLLLTTTFFLSACNDNPYVQDLRNYIAELKNTITKHNKKKEIVLPTPKPVTYEAKKLRSPFEIAVPMGKNAAITHPLQAFPLNTLQFKGTLAENNQIQAFILAPDNKLYPVKIGDKIGDHYGRIVKIAPNRIEIEETGEDAAGTEKRATRRIVTLQLKDAS